MVYSTKLGATQWVVFKAHWCLPQRKVSPFRSPICTASSLHNDITQACRMKFVWETSWLMECFYQESMSTTHKSYIINQQNERCTANDLPFWVLSTPYSLSPFLSRSWARRYTPHMMIVTITLQQVQFSVDRNPLNKKWNRRKRHYLSCITNRK